MAKEKVVKKYSDREIGVLVDSLGKVRDDIKHLSESDADITATLKAHMEEGVEYSGAKYSGNVTSYPQKTLDMVKLMSHVKPVLESSIAKLFSGLAISDSRLNTIWLGIVKIFTPYLKITKKDAESLLTKKQINECEKETGVNIVTLCINKV